MQQIVEMIETADKIRNLDLTRIVKKVQTEKQWTKEKVEDVERRYKNWLLLITTLDDTADVVPTLDIDEVWHAHILDTKAYFNDCQNIFGYFLHHVPSWNKRMPREAHDATALAYEKLFGESFLPEGSHCVATDCQGSPCTGHCWRGCSKK